MVPLVFSETNPKAQKALKWREICKTVMEGISDAMLRVHLHIQSNSPCTDKKQIHWQGSHGSNLWVPKQSGNPANVFAPYLCMESLAGYRGELSTQQGDPLPYHLNFKRFFRAWEFYSEKTIVRETTMCLAKFSMRKSTYLKCKSWTQTRAP